MNKKRDLRLFIILLFAFTFLNRINAQNSTDKSVYIYEYREPYFNIPVYIDTVIADRKFNFISEAETSRCYYFNYGPYRSHFYARPGVKYNVELPDISDIDDDWKKDQYFTLLPHHAFASPEISHEEDFELNNAIREFEEEYEPFLSKQTLRYFQPEYARIQLDSFIKANYQGDPEQESEYFFQYKRYKKAILFYHLKQQNLDTLINEYLAGSAVRFELPPYRTFFSLVLGNYFDYLQRKDQFDRIYTEFNKFKVDNLIEYLKRDPLLQNDTILQLIMLKECYNAFYSDKMNKKHLINFTDSIYHYTDIQNLRLTAKILKRKFTHLGEGFPAPTFSAITANGDSIFMNGDYNKLIYLSFCDLQSIHCLQEIEYLKYLGKKHGQFIRIVAVLRASSHKQLKEITENAGENLIVIPWKENEEIPDLFDVRAIPMFFLIDKDGKMLRNPAPAPSENFEYILFRILRSRGEV